MLQNIQNNTHYNTGYHNNSFPVANTSYNAGQFTQPSLPLSSLYQVLTQLISQLSLGSYQQNGYYNQPAQAFNQQQGQYNTNNANTAGYFQPNQPSAQTKPAFPSNPQASNTISAQTKPAFPLNPQMANVASNAGFNNVFNEYDDKKGLRAQVQNFSQAAGLGQGTGTGLDYIVSNILDDAGLAKRAKGDNVTGGAFAANALNHLFVKAVQATGADADGQFTTEELATIGKLVQTDYKDLYTALHGDDEKGEETGFHLVQNNGGTTKLNLDGKNRNAVNTVFDGFYHFGFDINNKGRYLNEDGNANQKVSDVAAWLNNLYFQAPDQEKGHGNAIAAFEQNNAFGGAFNTFNGAQTHKGSDLQQSLAQYSQQAANGQGTGTGLDSIIENILNDQGLKNKISSLDQRGGAYAANGLNHLFNDAALAIGATADGQFTEEEVRNINKIISEQHVELFKQLHGDDEGKEETGFHLVQNDGATTKLKLDRANRNAVNTIYDGFYHFGFEASKDRFLNEDGNANQKISDVTNWLNAIYFDK